MNDLNFDIPTNALARVIAKCTFPVWSSWPELNMSRENLLKLQEGVGEYAHRIALGATQDVLEDLSRFMIALAIAIEESAK